MRDVLDRTVQLGSQSKLKPATPIALGLMFWAVMAALWLFLFRRPAESGAILHFLLIIAVAVPAYIGTVVGCVMSYYVLHATNGRSWSARIGLFLCGSATVLVVVVLLWLAAGGPGGLRGT